MIAARYSNGLTYTCHDWPKLDLDAMKLDGLEDLRVDPFRLHFLAHGKPIRHFMRRGKQVSVAAVAATKEGEEVPGKDIYCYVLETELWKIFVFDSGAMAILKDWDEGSAWFSSPKPLPETPAKVNGGKTKAK
jgi:hypothetical protein